MESATTIRLAQDRETPATVVRRAHYAARYAYARAADTRAAGDCGQDYLAIRDDERRLVFALCDGVSQSFFGEIAAHVAGEALLDWFWEDLGRLEEAAVRLALTERLERLSVAASREVGRFPLPADVPPIVRDVLERKRALGSQTTFAAGLVDIESSRVLLAWMGDSRIRLWSPGGELTPALGDAFHTRERWSTRRGPQGKVHAFVAPLADIERILVYSDGLAELNTTIGVEVDDELLNALIAKAGASAASDDISVLEIRLAPGAVLPAAPVEPRVVLQAGQALVNWRPIPNASHYEMEIRDGATPHVQVTAPPWRGAPEQLQSADAVRVRAWRAGQAGPWSDWTPIAQPDERPRSTAALRDSQEVIGLGRPVGATSRGAAAAPRASVLLGTVLLGLALLGFLAFVLHWLH